MVESVVGRVVVMVVVGVVGGMAAIMLVRAEAAARAATNSTSSTQQEELKGNGRAAALVTSGGSDTSYTKIVDGNMGVKPQQSSPSDHNLQGTRGGTDQLQREGSLLDALLSIINRKALVAQQEASNSREKREVAQQETGINGEKREVHEHPQNARRKREELSKMETESHQPLPTTRHKIRHQNRKVHHRHYDRLDSSEITEATEKLAMTQQQEEEIERKPKSEINEGVVKENTELGLSSSISDTEVEEVSANSNNINSAAVGNITMQHPTKDRIILVSTANLKVSVLLAIPLALLLTFLLLVCVSLCCCCWRIRRKTSNDYDTTPRMEDEAQAEEGGKLEWWIPFGRCEACLPDISYQIHRDANPQYKPLGDQSSAVAKTVPDLNTIIKSKVPYYSRPPLIHDLLSNLPPGASRIGFEDERMLIDKDEDWSLEPGVFEDEVQVSYGMNRRARSLESLVL